MWRKAALVSLVAALAAGCGQDTTESEPGKSVPAPSPVVAPPPEFWSQPADTPERLADVAQATRNLDMCALLPRTVLAEVGEVRAITVGLNSCTAELAEDARINWAATLLPELTPNPRAHDENLGDLQLRVVPDRPEAPRSCGITIRFPATAALYLGVTPRAGIDPCDLARDLVPGIVDRWRAGPGRSPDTPDTVLRGADPCVVRDRLTDATPADALVRLGVCTFDYRGERVTVTYDYRIPESLAQRATVEDLAGHTVYRTVSVYDNSIPIYQTAVGPELPEGTTAYGARVPACEVSAATDPVAREVIGQVIALFT